MATAKQRAREKRDREKAILVYQRASGARLKEIREARGMSARELGQAVGVTPSSQYRRECGGAGWSVGDAMLYSRALEVLVTFLAAHDDGAPTPRHIDGPLTTVQPYPQIRKLKSEG